MLEDCISNNPETGNFYQCPYFFLAFNSHEVSALMGVLIKTWHMPLIFSKIQTQIQFITVPGSTVKIFNYFISLQRNPITDTCDSLFTFCIIINIVHYIFIPTILNIVHFCIYYTFILTYYLLYTNHIYCIIQAN